MPATVDAGREIDAEINVATDHVRRGERISSGCADPTDSRGEAAVVEGPEVDWFLNPTRASESRGYLKARAVNRAPARRSVLLLGWWGRGFVEGRAVYIGGDKGRKTANEFGLSGWVHTLRRSAQ
jgi:hypothetical protein